MFDGHYVNWREQRFRAIIDRYGKLFFKGKTILEVGCGFGDLGARFHEFGAAITCSDARQDYLQVAKQRYPFVETICADLDNEWPFDFYDMIIHFGTLYHLQNVEYNLSNTCWSCNHLVLETEVCDSSDPDTVIYVTEEGWDKAYNKVGCRPSPAYVERCLHQYNMKIERVLDGRGNSDFHVYDWKITETKKYHPGLRRFWFCETADKKYNEVEISML